jgi:hypothetical protein
MLVYLYILPLFARTLAKLARRRDENLSMSIDRKRAAAAAPLAFSLLSQSCAFQRCGMWFFKHFQDVSVVFKSMSCSSQVFDCHTIKVLCTKMFKVNVGLSF